MRKNLLAMFFAVVYTGLVSSQSLSKVCPILLHSGSDTDTSSFIISVADLNLLFNKPSKYKSSLQIIDAKEPWPPRWFVCNQIDSPAALPFYNMTPHNAEQQFGKFTFLTLASTKYNDKQMLLPISFVTCNKLWQPLDTFYQPGKELDTHEYRISEAGEKLYFLVVDTMINAKEIFGHDTLLTLTYEIIEVADAKGKVVFDWNPLEHLGLNSLYKPYAKAGRLLTTHNTFAWSHGNSLSFDFDGDILYSFKHIGIGKISRKNGNFIWRLDRNRLQMNEHSDTLPIYAQHDFRPAKDKTGKSFYTVLSNGDEMFPYCTAYQFSVVQSKTGVQELKLLKKVSPYKAIPETHFGNYDFEPDGRELFNYGSFEAASGSYVPFFEYRDKSGRRSGRYDIPSPNICSRVHFLDTDKPPRPLVKFVNGRLLASGGSQSYTWFRLHGANNLQVEEVGTGDKIKPLVSGWYCTVSEYGIGYSVSKPLFIKL